MYQRWYDQEPNCTKMLVHLREIKQPEVQEFCGRMMLTVGEHLRKEVQRQSDRGVSSIGIGGIEALYQFSREKRRWYDTITSVKQAVNLLYTLPPEGIVAYGFALGDTMGLISIYSQVCIDTKQKPTINDLVNISKTSLEQGLPEAIDLLKSLIGDELFNAIYDGDVVKAEALLEQSEKEHQSGYTGPIKYKHSQDNPKA